MRYEMMFAHQLRKALDEKWPVVLPMGVLEYHAEHCVMGVDGLLPLRALELLEREVDIVLLPPFYYGAASYAVEPPERNGTVHIDSDALHTFARPLFRSLLRIGFRNIHCVYHHQTENYLAGMPTDLAFKLAARQEIFAFLEKQGGEGWWGSEKSQDYYSQHQKGNNPFNWIQIHPFKDAEIQKLFPGDHAGESETSLMMVFCPEGVDMSQKREKWYTKSADKASMKYGLAAKEMIMARLKRILVNG